MLSFLAVVGPDSCFMNAYKVALRKHNACSPCFLSFLDKQVGISYPTGSYTVAVWAFLCWRPSTYNQYHCLKKVHVPLLPPPFQSWHPHTPTDFLSHMAHWNEFMEYSHVFPRGVQRRSSQWIVPLAINLQNIIIWANYHGGYCQKLKIVTI